MRVIVAAIALIFIIGVALPTPADARAPRKVEKWGCTFKALGVGSEGVFGHPVPWGGLADIGQCDKKHRFVVRLAVVEVIPGAPNRVYSRRKTTRLHRPGPGGIRYVVDGGVCAADGSRPTTYPTYVRMRVTRQGKPGVVRVASRSRANPCKGVENIAWVSGR